uniref:Helicase with zinc finger 2, transcriptional coactivator n=1 Tax=Cyprinus carpio TaxID=7962 RepID=A0A8C1QLH8_CYPCA
MNEISSPPMGRVINILESADTVKEFVCTLERHDSQVMTPINKCISKIYTPFWKDKPNHIAVRDPENLKVERFIKINEEWRNFNKYPLGIVVGHFPKITTLEDGLKVLDIEFQLRRTLSSSLEREMRDFQRLDLFEDGRIDFCMLPTFTIDPADSQDLDDAISVRDLGECYEIGVHISDVASFVAKDSELDKYAKLLCTSFYPCGKEPKHMFPKELSADFFSLIPNQDRRAISLIIQVDTKTNSIKTSLICKSVIQSKRKFSYDEVENILENKHQQSDLLQMCLVKAWNFAKVHRRDRKPEDWCYKKPDEDVTLGRRRSHLMVEELMIMFNQMVAERLLFDETTRSITPLRCQDRPKSENEHVSHELINRRAMTNPQIHPQLLPLAMAFSRLFHKACILRSNSTHVSRIGHYDLDLDSYTWASSPIRRYIDVIVQRLLHSVTDKTNVRYTGHDIDLSCMEFSRKNDHQSAYEKKSNALHFAIELSNQISFCLILYFLKGCNISKQIPARFEIDGYCPAGLSYLNNSQCRAIREALANPFTLIQGPPGERYFWTLFGFFGLRLL